MFRTLAIAAVSVAALSSVSLAGHSQSINLGGSRQVTFASPADHARAPYALTGQTYNGPAMEVVRLSTQTVTVRRIR